MSNDIATHATGAKKPFPFLALVALLVALAALAITIRTAPERSGTPAGAEVSTLVSVNRSKILRVGYEGYPPYTVKDPATGRLTGFSVDLAELIAADAGWKVEWVETSADTKIPDLQAGKFDVMTEPIFMTVPRAVQVSFSRPYAYFGDAAAIVRKGEKRFKAIDELNVAGVTIAVRQGYTDQTYAANNLPRATLRVLRVDDISQLFLEVISGKADVALSDLGQVQAFAVEHAKEVEARFTNPAPSYIPAGFMIRQGDFAFYNFINSALGYLESNAEIARLNKKYGLTSEGPPSSR